MCIRDSTKLDVDTRGGAALSIKAVVGKPIKFSGTGEKLSDCLLYTSAPQPEPRPGV